MNPATPVQQRSDRRRYSDPPLLWISLLGGSVGIHLLLFLCGYLTATRWLKMQVTVDPIAVDVVPSVPESAPSISSSSTRSTPNPAIASSTPPPVTQPNSAPRQPAATPVPIEPSQPSLQRSPTGDNRRQVPPTTPQHQQRPPRQKQPPRSPLPVPFPGASNSPRSAPPDGTMPSPNPAHSPASTPDPPLSSPSPLPDTGSASPSPGASPSLPPTGSSGNSPLPTVPISSNPVPAQFSAKVIKVEPSTDAKDPPAHFATLIPGKTTQTFTSTVSEPNGCLLTPESLHGFKQTVILRIVVNRQGKVDDQEKPSIRRSSGNDRYDELAACVIRNWTFNPAYNLKNGRRDYVYSNVDVQVEITKL